MTGNPYRFLFILTPIFFLAGFIHITFSLAALLCMSFPFIMIAKTGHNQWCSGICPRASFFTRLKWASLKKPLPEWLRKEKAKKMILSYFCMNLMFILFSTFSVSAGEMEKMDFIRFLMLLPFNGPLPQVLQFTEIPDWLIHFSYRIYSLMFSSALVGTFMALWFKPRSWCAVCPVRTMGSSLVKIKRSETNS